MATPKAGASPATARPQPQPKAALAPTPMPAPAQPPSSKSSQPAPAPSIPPQLMRWCGSCQAQFALPSMQTGVTFQVFIYVHICFIFFCCECVCFFFLHIFNFILGILPVLPRHQLCFGRSTCLWLFSSAAYAATIPATTAATPTARSSDSDVLTDAWFGVRTASSSHAPFTKYFSARANPTIVDPVSVGGI
jgi:hypothetical protein